MWQNAALVFLGGGIGSLFRFGITAATKRFSPEAVFPLATLFSNLLSCLIMGITVAYFADRIAENNWMKFFILIGICGGFSTFSTFSNETLELMRNGNMAYAIINIVASISLCLLILFLFVKKTT